MPKLVKKVKVEAWEYNNSTFPTRSAAVADAVSDAVTAWHNSRTADQTTQLRAIDYKLRGIATDVVAQAIIDLGLALKAVLDSIDDN